MFGTLIVAAMEASIGALEASTAIMMRMEKRLKGSTAVRSDADLIRLKLVVLQRAFADALSDPAQAKTGEALRSIILASYERLLAERSQTRRPEGLVKTEGIQA
jgi:hypothetical protein